MPIYYNILVAEFLAREHGPVLFWLILPWNSHYLSLEEAGGGGGVGVGGFWVYHMIFRRNGGGINRH